jgi:uncharacterized SAM-binding protein YcdF (DUF218 family)
VLLALALVGRQCGTVLVVEQPLDHPDAILSLASHEWERLPEALRLGLQYPAARILLTRPPRVSAVNCHDCGTRVHNLVRLGIAANRISVIQITTNGTFGEALATVQFARKTGIRRLLIVTSPYHTRRAFATFRRAFAPTGIEVGIRPASDTSPADPERWWSTPYDRSYVRYEWLAIPYYAVRYRVDPR